MAELVFIRRGEELMRVALDRPRIVIGRGPECDVALPHPEVSRAHAALERTGDGWTVVDLSGRGTVVGGAAVARAPLAEGDELGLGDFRIILRGEPPPEMLPTAVGRDLTERAPAAGALPPGTTLRIRWAGAERVVPLAAELTAGKDPGCTLRLEDPFVSSVHLRLVRRADGLHVVDLASTNGTWVDGVRVGEAALGIGSTVRLGETDLSVEAPAGTAPQVFEGIVTADRGMREVFDLVERVAPSGAPVAIFGETGTGKELVAHAIHARSERASGPFIPVNCAAIASELVESELFGHERGSFTGAAAARRGAFEEASGGTIFLDEIGELSLDLQAKLLRTLESGEIKRVGASKPFRVDARVVSATHRDLRAAVKRGSFREDLYYRLAVIRVELPPLRRRPGDVPLLAEHFLRTLAPRGGSRPTFHPAALERLSRHPWPGNIRELRNVLARALLLRRGAVIGASDLAFDGDPPPDASPASPGSDSFDLAGKTLAQIEEEAIRRALLRHGGNRRAAARELGIARSTVQKRAAELGIPQPGDDDEPG
jgi:DNA-binding NtrC family response regulator